MAPARPSGVEVLGVVLDVMVHEGEDEEVAVVVALQEETEEEGQLDQRNDHEDQERLNVNPSEGHCEESVLLL